MSSDEYKQCCYTVGKPHDIAYGPTAEDYIDTERSRMGAEAIRNSYQQQYPRDHKATIQTMQKMAWRLMPRNESRLDKFVRRLLTRFISGE